ncbi:MAG: glutamine--fructose-6-phosphate transaminase (isomerizing) [SAR324 cluster bacterium]|nr:glutamine--fructose-6-phosphate transaminase (isomerizing) [SAR324 cluster bacterium]
MCGIVGFVGNGVIPGRLLQGLQRLEYRGYDSAGMALCTEDSHLHILRRVGKLANLKNDTPEFLETIHSPIRGGIAHTRWATHGKPSEANAHPHLSQNGTIAVVHNGIIENYQTLKDQLIRQGFEFKSETDTEVLAHLIEYHYQGNLFSAVLSALNLVEGTYGIAVLNALEPNVLVAARKSSPLVVGLATEGNYVASDMVAMVQETQRVIHLDDYDVVLLSEDPPVITNLKNKIREYEVSTVDFHLDDVSKGNFEHFMLKEIHEQPDTIRNATRGRMDYETGNAKLNGLGCTAYDIAQIRHVTIVACGTSRYAGLVGEYLIETLAGITVDVEYASEFRYRNPVIMPGTVVLAISQSGETADTLAALMEAKLKGATVFGIVNSVSSAIAREAGRGIYLHAGPEISVASTKAFTSQVMVLTLLGLLLGRSSRHSLTEGQNLIREIEALPEKIEYILKNERPKIYQAAQYLKDFENVFYIGRSFNYPVALEGALKLKEISYIHAEGYESAELKHGPIALLDSRKPVLAIMSNQAGYEKIVGSVKEVMARDAPVICLGTEGNTTLSQYSPYVLSIPECPELLSPVLNTVVLQLLAYEVAVAKGLSVDQPRNLAKSVTVE